MRHWRRFFIRLRNVFTGRCNEERLKAEIEEHLALQTQDNLRAGMSPAEARRQAILKFGAVEAITETYRDQEGLSAIETTLGDVKYGLRVLRKSPGFTAIAVITLALGIGANTAIFSLVNAVVLRSIPIEDPKNVVVLEWSANVEPEVHWFSSYGDTIRTPRNTGFSFSHPFVEEVEKSGIFEGVGSFAGGGHPVMSGNGPAEIVTSEGVSGGFFETLGIKPAFGRVLQPSDDDPSAPPALVLNYNYWMKAFGGSPDAVGKTVKLNGVAFTIVGVLEPKFVALSFGNVQDVWYPMNVGPMLNAHWKRRNPDARAWWALIAGRLKPGVSASRAQAQLDVLFRNHLLHSSKPIIKEQDQSKITLMPAREALVGSAGDFTDPLRYMSGAVGIVLLIACANVAGLILSRASRRKREIAVRLALGARRSRLLRQLLTESVILSLAGGALGVIVGFWGARVLVAMMGLSDMHPLGLEAKIDLRVLAFTAAVSILTGVLFGLVPAFRSLRLDVTPALKGDAAASAGPQGHRRWLTTGNALVVVQAALAIIVLTGAGLLVHTLRNLQNVNPGFDTRNLLTFDISPEQADKGVPANELFERLRSEIAAMPGVISVSYSFAPLLAGELSTTTFRFGPKKEIKDADWMPASSEFFATLKIPFVAGRNLSRSDYEIATKNSQMQKAREEAKPGRPKPPAPTVPMPVVVNQEFVEQYFPGINPLGQHFGAEDGSDEEHWGKGAGYEIVGIVGNAKYNDLKRAVAPTMYVPFANPDGSYEVRTATDPKGYIAPIRSVINRFDGNVPMQDPRTQSEHIEGLLSQERAVAELSSFFGFLALLLACLGLYGLLSYEVTRRTSEIGIRMALGAHRADLVRMVVLHGIMLASLGTAAGILAAIAVGHLLTKLLWGVKPTDPLALIAVTALLIAVALVAALIPARRATRVDPIVALRYE